MKRTLILSVLALGISVLCAAQVTLKSGMTVTPANAPGLDKPYDFTSARLVPAPDGYEPCFIEHYGRHGSRFAYSSSFYTSLKKALDKAASCGVLTDFGESLLKSFSVNYQTYLYRTGDLSDLGWEQLGRIAGTMYDSFPEAFRDGYVMASASLSTRSIMSMSSFCLALQRKDVNLPIREENGKVFLDGTNPRDRSNPFIVKRYETPFPFRETLDEFQDLRLDYKVILSKLFTDVDKACEGQSGHELVRNMYVLVSGMNSIPEEIRTDFTGLFTEEEYALMYEVDNYQRYEEYFPYQPRCVPILLDFIKDADRRIAENGKGATCRFGHDHVVMPVLSLLGMNGYERYPETIDQITAIFNGWDSPMAANIQFVMYCPAGQTPSQENVIFRPLLNGQPAVLACKPLSTGFYRWSDFKEWAAQRISRYVPVN